MRAFHATDTHTQTLAEAVLAEQDSDSLLVRSITRENLQVGSLLFGFVMPDKR
jgi:hypothetical protein